LVLPSDSERQDKRTIIFWRLSITYFSLSTKKKPSLIHLFPQKADLNQMNNIIFSWFILVLERCGGVDSDGNMCRGMRTRHLPERDAWLRQDSLARVQAIQVFFTPAPQSSTNTILFPWMSRLLGVFCWGQILGWYLNKSLKSFSPCYSQSPLQLCLERFLFLQTHATSYSFYRSSTVHCKGENLIENDTPFPLV
jgi:hypothetical protein